MKKLIGNSPFQIWLEIWLKTLIKSFDSRPRTYIGLEIKFRPTIVLTTLRPTVISYYNTDHATYKGNID